MSHLPLHLKLRGVQSEGKHLQTMMTCLMETDHSIKAKKQENDCQKIFTEQMRLTPRSKIAHPGCLKELLYNNTVCPTTKDLESHSERKAPTVSAFKTSQGTSTPER